MTRSSLHLAAPNPLPSAQATMTEPLLKLEQIDTFYGQIQVHFGVNLSIGRGEIVSLLGGNASGKSTAMKVILGLHKPRAGVISFGGEALNGLPTSQVVRRGIASVPEARRLFGDMTVRENLLMGAYARRARKAELAADLEEVFALFPALVRYRERLAGSLSGGEQQMVAIGRALMAKPELLLLDEPSLGLAPKVRGENFGALARLAGRGVTILLVEQNLRLAARICERAYVMQRGRIVGTETADELARSARHVYLESPG
jgi:branched-chain amino acid transport system ATP-binding protein